MRETSHSEQAQAESDRRWMDALALSSPKDIPDGHVTGRMRERLARQALVSDFHGLCQNMLAWTGLAALFVLLFIYISAEAALGLVRGQTWAMRSLIENCRDCLGSIMGTII